MWKHTDGRRYWVPSPNWYTWENDRSVREWGINHWKLVVELIFQTPTRIFPLDSVKWCPGSKASLRPDLQPLLSQVGNWVPGLKLKARYQLSWNENAGLSILRSLLLPSLKHLLYKDQKDMDNSHPKTQTFSPSLSLSGFSAYANMYTHVHTYTYVPVVANGMCKGLFTYSSLHFKKTFINLSIFTSQLIIKLLGTQYCIYFNW